MKTPTKKIRDCGALTFPIYEKLIKMRADYVLICEGEKSLTPLA